MYCIKVYCKCSDGSMVFGTQLTAATVKPLQQNPSPFSLLVLGFWSMCPLSSCFSLHKHQTWSSYLSVYLSLPPWSFILLMTDITQPAFTLFLPPPESNLQSRQVKHPFTTEPDSWFKKKQLVNVVCNQIPTFVTLEIKSLNPFIQSFCPSKK